MLIFGRRSGNYRQSGGSTRKRVCRECTQDRVNYARSGQAAGLNCPLNQSAFEWEQAARYFKIEITGLKLSQMSDRVAT